MGCVHPYLRGGDCAGGDLPGWFSHYLISQFGIDRVAREPIFKHRDAGSRWQAVVPGGGVKLDVVVMREPGVNLPHYVHRGGDGTGMHTLDEMAVISELKVSSTAGGGLDHREVAQDVYKLSLLLEQAAKQGVRTPLAYVGVFDNRVGKPYRWQGLDKRLGGLEHDTDVRILRFPKQ